MDKDYDSLIKEKQKKLSEVKSEIEPIKNKFIEDTIKFISKWYYDTTEKNIKNQSDITLKLGKEKLKVMKSKLSELIENSKQITMKELSEETLWINLKEKSSFSDHCNTKESLDAVIRYILGLLYNLLKEFGYIKEERDWEEWSNREGDGKPFYPFSLDWSREMNKTFEEYKPIMDSAHNIFRGIEDLEMEKKQSQAKDLWDSA